MEMATRVVSALPAGTAVSRYIIAKALGRGDSFTEKMVAERWKDTPQVAATLSLHTKAAVPAGSTTDATWAGPLAVHGISQEALTLMRGMSILGALDSRMQKVHLEGKAHLGNRRRHHRGMRGSLAHPFRSRRRTSPPSSKSITSSASSRRSQQN